ncbi:MAG TPA: DUF6264 family protein, partial [Terrimesophilobacter sp.]|nr:DUF6264 family protein [Terrimesophilobacter sp.]
ARAIEASGGTQDWQRRAAFPPASERETRHPLTGLGASRASARTTSGSYSANRFATIFLLGVGLIAVLQSVFGYLNLAATIQTLYTQQGIGDYTPTGLTDTIGIALIVVHATVWLLTAWVSLRVLARGGTAWWIPLVGATLTFIIMASLMAVLLLVDPAFQAYLGVA